MRVVTVYYPHAGSVREVTMDTLLFDILYRNALKNGNIRCPWDALRLALQGASQ